MLNLGYILVALILWLIIYSIYRMYRRKVTVHEIYKALLFTKGKYVKTLDPGQYVINPKTSELLNMDMRHQFAMISGQEVLSIDGVSIKISLIAIHGITDPYLAYTSAENSVAAIYSLLQLALREIVANLEIDDLLAKRQEIGELVKARVAERVTAYGHELHEVSIKDMMFPGALRNTFAAIVTARKEALASLERARGEAAAMRSLANSARLMESNPHLLQLRTLQYLGESTGHTVVLNMSPNLDPVSLSAGTVADAE